MASPEARADVRAIMGEVKAGCAAATGRVIPEDFLDHMMEVRGPLPIQSYHMHPGQRWCAR